MNLTRPFISRPLLVTKGVREACAAARAAGLELRSDGGKWSVHTVRRDGL